MKDFAPLAVIVLCFIAGIFLLVALLKRIRGKLQGEYPFGFGVLSPSIAVSLEEAQFFNINEHDKPLIEKFRRTLFAGVTILIVLSFLALNVLHQMFP
ncbi:hypothetical protein [Methylobacterium bullatum]|uniref:hypothetical protein n=1 Tax=Methylobacterium bullatum TaxID=570505 RepID=UPI0017820A78|nr:hypothetical protein [Methylobacterium bullatum]